MHKYTPRTAVYELGEAFYAPVAAAQFSQLRLRYSDDAAAKSVGLNLSATDWVRHFGEFEPLPNNLSEPLALKYHGHQFRHYNPDIGDGRGFLFAQMEDAAGRLIDLGTKGSGQTPFSRSGDGRLTLLGGVREVLATRYLEHLGVNTSRSFCLVETNEALQRNDEPSPTRAAVLTRLSHSHIRFGSFQRQAFFGKTDNLQALTDYSIRHFYPDADDAVSLFEAVSTRCADTVASWMAAGFVHGVMNTDNMNITGESFDYGPYRFLPTYDPKFTAAYFDHGGLYAFGRQPEAMAWNLAQLAQCLSLIAEDKPLIKVLEDFGVRYQLALSRHVFRRLGLASKSAEIDSDFVATTFEILHASQTAWPEFWHDWCGGAARADGAQLGDYAGQDWAEWIKVLGQFEPVADQPKTDRPASLLYDEIGALWQPIVQDDDWSAFETKLESYARAS